MDEAIAVHLAPDQLLQGGQGLAVCIEDCANLGCEFILIVKLILLQLFLVIPLKEEEILYHSYTELITLCLLISILPSITKDLSLLFYCLQLLPYFMEKLRK